MEAVELPAVLAQDEASPSFGKKGKGTKYNKGKN